MSLSAFVVIVIVRSGLASSVTSTLRPRDPLQLNSCTRFLTLAAIRGAKWKRREYARYVCIYICLIYMSYICMLYLYMYVCMHVPLVGTFMELCCHFGTEYNKNSGRKGRNRFAPSASLCALATISRQSMQIVIVIASE